MSLSLTLPLGTTMEVTNEEKVLTGPAGRTAVFAVSAMRRSIRFRGFARRAFYYLLLQLQR